MKNILRASVLALLLVTTGCTAQVGGGPDPRDTYCRLTYGSCVPQLWQFGDPGWAVRPYYFYYYR